MRAVIADACQRQVTRPAEDDFRLLQRLAACICQPVKAIFAETDQG